MQSKLAARTGHRIAKSRHIDNAVQVLSVTVLSVLVVGLILAIVDRFYPALFFGILVPAVVVLAWWMRGEAGLVGEEPDTSIDRDSGTPIKWVPLFAVVLGLVIIAAISALNVKSSSEHLLTDRDPGVYITTGKWLASNHTLLIDGTVGGFEGIPWIEGTSQGFHGRPDGLVYPQFNHGFPVVLAIGDWIGGDRLMLNTTPLIGAAFLSLLFLLLWRMFSPWIAVIALGTVAFNLVFWHFSRDAYSEPLVALVLVMGLLAAHRGTVLKSQRSWLLAGALIGSLALVRIDAWLYIGTFTLLMAVQSTMNRSSNLRRSTAVGCIAVMWAIGSIGVVDLAFRSPRYLRDLSGSVALMMGFAVMCGIVAFVLLILVSILPGRVLDHANGLWNRFERSIRIAVATSIGLFAVWAVVVRPKFFIDTSGQSAHVGGLANREGLTDDGTRSFLELSGQWFTWYWGWVTVLMATLGWMATVARRRFDERRFFWIGMALTGLPLVPYIIDPSINADQIWAMRRFYPTGLVGIAIAVAATVLVLSHSRRWGRGVGLVGAIAVFVGVAVVPLWYALPLATASTQVGVYRSVHRLCDVLPDDAALLISDDHLGLVLVAAPRSFCNVPVARSVGVVQPDDVDEVASRWKDKGRTLFLLTQNPASLPGKGSHANLVSEMAISFSFPDYALSYRPSSLAHGGLQWQLWEWEISET